MTSVLLTSLLVLSALAGPTWAEAGLLAWNLGQYCGDVGRCVNPRLRLLCDRATDTCKVATGEPCGMVEDAVGTSDSCVSGAECVTTTGKCTCKGPLYTDDGNGYCNTTTDKFGGACNNDHTCATTGLTCNRKNICVCMQNRSPDLAQATCIVSYILCDEGDDCFDSPNTFDCTFNTCSCSGGYSGVQGTGICDRIVTATVVGKACTVGGSECGDQNTTHLVCVNGFCACAPGYYGIQGDVCYVAAGQLGGGCFTLVPGTRGTCSSDDLVCKESENSTNIMICAQGGSVGLVASVLWVVTATIAGWLSIDL